MTINARASNTRRAAAAAHSAAGAEHRANDGTGEKPAPGKRETPPGGDMPPLICLSCGAQVRLGSLPCGH
ncbi:hypothetical protein [Burkholderia vietnamiensis]|uniref:hypothetical protein n=1 Tax=Burkholderia vietnamiensis TaxID=60552 RepID=UPI00158C5FAB|nr:hypothetical protein [Burkholderia vietnamiensis]MEC4595479.1 hypothetical protein [Burkholderia vietnamiensis]HDR9052655.1 hypothetical protein [Burkholderia vietnamiensis]